MHSPIHGAVAATRLPRGRTVVGGQRVSHSHAREQTGRTRKKLGCAVRLCRLRFRYLPNSSERRWGETNQRAWRYPCSLDKPSFALPGTSIHDGIFACV